MFVRVVQFICERIVELAGTDPRYASLVEALIEECPGNKGFPWREWHKRARMERAFVPPCCVNGRVLHSWEDLPQGALRGVILCYVEAAAAEALLDRDGNEYYSLRDLEEVITRTFRGPDCDSHIVKLMLEYLEKVKEAAHAKAEV